jgi:hypothetical protein
MVGTAPKAIAKRTSGRVESGEWMELVWVCWVVSLNDCRYRKIRDREAFLIDRWRLQRPLCL